ncbi:uncharacterized protein METZ01_LOCUS403926 [marine metagenome]|uniref:Uncharacterized protein n=1 Tax=marine metagenome TaxID=408172 RepID=A0A382VX29_9ZZZZ
MGDCRAGLLLQDAVPHAQRYTGLAATLPGVWQEAGVGESGGARVEFEQDRRRSACAIGVKDDIDAGQRYGVVGVGRCLGHLAQTIQVLLVKLDAATIGATHQGGQDGGDGQHRTSGATRGRVIRVDADLGVA